MRKRGSVFLCLLLAISVFLLCPQKAFAAEGDLPFVLGSAVELPAPPAIASDYALLMDADTGIVLYEKNGFEKAWPASTTKILTGLLAAETLDPEADLTFSYRATHELPPGDSTLARTEGEIMSVRDCLYALMVASANEVAQGLSEEVSGSFEAFAELMNKRAAELGAINSHFTNSHGLHDDAHYTCAYDLALFMRAAMENPLLRDCMSTVGYRIAPTNKHSEITSFRTHHPLLIDNYQLKYEYALAGKTGYTSQALNNLVTYAEKDGVRLIAVTLHVSGTEASGKDSRALLSYGFDNFVLYETQGTSELNRADSFLEADLITFSPTEKNNFLLPVNLSPEELDSEIIFEPEGENSLAYCLYSYHGTVLFKQPLTISRARAFLPLEPKNSVAPTRNEILRTRYLGVPLIYWLIIFGGLLLLAAAGTAVWFILSLIKRRERRRRLEHIK